MTEYDGLALVGGGAALILFLLALREWWRGTEERWPRQVMIEVRVVAEDKEHEADEEAVAEADNLTEEEVATDVAENEPKRRRFLVDSMMLLTCYRYLFGDLAVGDSEIGSGGGIFRESFVYCTGVRAAENTYCFTHLLPVEFAFQHAAGVRVAEDSNIQTFAALDDLELPLVAHCHSHPGQFGAAATHPSSTDRAFQRRLDQGGSLAVGLIFSRSSDGHGYVRFFGGKDADFSVEVQGAYVKQVDKHVFRLSLEHGELPIQTVIAR